MKHMFIFVPIILLCACASKRPAVVQMPRTTAGTTLPREGLETVRYGENVKAYPIGRYIEPNNRLVMHEAHTVYRVETTAKWNLHPNAPVNIPTGPVVQIIDPARKESPVSPEVVAEVSKQKEATQTVIEQGNRINQTLSQLSQNLSATKQVADENAQLRQEVSSTRRRLEVLEEQFRKRTTDTAFTTTLVPTKGTNDW
jgi:hypothetical protein